MSWAGATGSDRRSAITVTLGTDGLPERFDVDPRWRQRVAPSELVGAVTEAHSQALSNRSAKWTAARGTAPVPSDDVSREPDETPLRMEPRRTIDDLAEAAISGIAAARDAAQASRGDQAPVGRGTEGGVTIELARSGPRCDIDPRWAQQRSGTELGDALNGALRSARAQLSELAATPDDQGKANADTADLFEDSLAHLRKLASGT
ncbi:MAG: hypothetical protein J2P25_23380 [Nocardiopsaceae bacterium]|nr:hypothetical protein [Nocardiopsaceae bacterium]